MSGLSFPGNFPGNPLQKAGYSREFHDEFEGEYLDTEKWLPVYLPHWSSRARSTPNYVLENGCLVLQITADQQPWCREFDGEVRCSSIQTGEFGWPVGSKIGQHRFNPACTVREAQPNQQNYTPLYGYFECRARAVANNTNHVALWRIGYEDAPERSGEIAIFEIMDASIDAGSSHVGKGLRRWFDPDLQDEFYEDLYPIDATQFHVYAVEWLRTHLDFYINQVKIRTILQSSHFPMQFMLSIYELPQKRQFGEVENEAVSNPKKSLRSIIFGLIDL